MHLGVFAFVAAKGVAYGLRSIVNLTEVHKSPPEAAIPSSPPRQRVVKGAIRTSSLQALATCSNFEIRKAAIMLLCERVLAHEPSRRQLQTDLLSPDPELSRMARLAYRLIRNYSDVEMPEMRSGWECPSCHFLDPHGDRTACQQCRLPAFLRYLPGATLPSSRHAEEQVEERELRRRRREAVVINDGDRPVLQEDVYMRDAAGHVVTEENPVDPTRV